MKKVRLSHILTLIVLLFSSMVLVWQAHGLADGAAADFDRGQSPAIPRPFGTGDLQETPVAPSEEYKGYLTPLFNFPPPSPEGCVPLPHVAPDSMDMEREIVTLINLYREEEGLPALRVIPQLTQAARRHAQDMAENDFRGHTGSDGSTQQIRAEEACYELTAIGQIIGSNVTADEMITAWTNSPGNRDLILTTTMVDMGAAYFYNPDNTFQHNWVVLIGRPAVDGTIAFD